jgi:hypothetical protein
MAFGCGQQVSACLSSFSCVIASALAADGQVVAVNCGLHLIVLRYRASQGVNQWRVSAE